MASYDPNFLKDAIGQMGVYLNPYVLSQTTVGLSILSITVIDSTHLKVTFSAIAKNNTALTNTDNYIISPYLKVYQVIPDNGFKFVTLTVDEMLQNRSYNLEIQNVEAA